MKSDADLKRDRQQTAGGDAVEYVHGTRDGLREVLPPRVDGRPEPTRLFPDGERYRRRPTMQACKVDEMRVWHYDLIRA